MSLHPAITALVSYGEEGEQKLLSVIGEALGEPVTKTKETFATLDFLGETVVAELKKRTSDWSYCDEKIQREGWLIPSCKILKGWEQIHLGKRVVFFYYWACDKTLWMYELEEGDFTAPGSHFIPRNHYDKMLHVAVPQSRWTALGSIDAQFEEEQCWIRDANEES